MLSHAGDKGSRRAERVATVAGLSVLAAAGGAQPAEAAKTWTYDALTDAVVGIGDETHERFAVVCLSGDVADSGDGMGIIPIPGPVPCAEVKTLRLETNGGDDLANISSLTGAAFPALAEATVVGGSGDDTVTLSSGAAWTHYLEMGADDDDVLTLGATATVNAGSGNDIVEVVDPSSAPLSVIAGTGSDSIVASDGNDTIDVGATDGAIDAVTAGGGTDSLEAAGTGVTVTHAVFHSGAEVDTYDSIELLRLEGTGGSDVLDGSDFLGDVVIDAGAGADSLTSGIGHDTITAGTEVDTVNTGAGDDRLELRDRFVDQADCGDDADTAIGDLTESLANCETQDLAALPDLAEPPVTAITPVIPVIPAVIDTTGPAISVPKPKISTKGKVTLAVSCPRGEVTCKGAIAAKARYRKGGERRRIALGSRAFTIAGGKRATVVLRTSRKARRLLISLRTKRLKVTVTLRARDAAGNLTTRRGTFTVKVP